MTTKPANAKKSAWTATRANNRSALVEPKSVVTPKTRVKDRSADARAKEREAEREKSRAASRAKPRNAIDHDHTKAAKVRAKAVAARPTRGETSAYVSGVLLTEDDFRRQVAEVMVPRTAEQMARLLERQRTGQNESRRGRPRLDDSVALTETLSIRVDKGTYGWIHEEVERRKVTMGELVRELFEAARRPA